MTNEITAAKLKAWIRAMETLAKEKYDTLIETTLGFDTDLESDIVRLVLGIRGFPNSESGLAFWEEINGLPEAIPSLMVHVAWAFPEETP